MSNNNFADSIRTLMETIELRIDHKLGTTIDNFENMVSIKTPNILLQKEIGEKNDKVNAC
jgi:hypothetical protein